MIVNLDLEFAIEHTYTYAYLSWFWNLRLILGLDSHLNINMHMWVIKNFSNSCSVSLTYVIHICTCDYARVTWADCIPEFSIRARIFRHYIYDGISDLELSF